VRCKGARALLLVRGLAQRVAAEAQEYDVVRVWKMK